MRQPRNAVPLLAAIALAALFLKLPEAPAFLGLAGCKTCSTQDPYLPMLGGGYFAALLAVSLLFPAFPSRPAARGGLIWAVLLAGALTYLDRPGWCAACLVAHACHILIWATWLACPAPAADPGGATFRERLCLAVFAPVSVVALFACMNLTFMAYGAKLGGEPPATTLQAGDPVPAFSVRTKGGRGLANADLARAAGTVINFVSPDCPYCQRQLPVLNAVARQVAAGSYRFVNVSPELRPDLLQRSPGSEWVEDPEGRLRQLFEVSGYPTMFVVGKDGRIAQVIPGVPDHLEAFLLGSLVKPKDG